MDTVLAVAISSVVVGVLALIGSIYGSRSAVKQTETLIVWRLAELEKENAKLSEEVRIHNNYISRMAGAESRLSALDAKTDRTAAHVKILEE